MFKNISFVVLVLIGGLDIGRGLLYIVSPLDGLERQAIGVLVHRSERGTAAYGDPVYMTHDTVRIK